MSRAQRARLARERVAYTRQNAAIGLVWPRPTSGPVDLADSELAARAVAGCRKSDAARWRVATKRTLAGSHVPTYPDTCTCDWCGAYR